MNGVMNRVEVQFFRTFSDIELIFACTGLCHHTFLQVRLGIPNNLTEQLSKTGSVVSLFVCITTESLGDLRITLTVSLTSHSQVLTYLGALTHEVCTQTLCDDRVLLIFRYT